jgi:4-hydroxy-tetrahydrodipicolinate synthase
LFGNAGPQAADVPTFKELKGVYPAATTQFHADQALDLDAMAKRIEAMLKAGVYGMILLGTAGLNCSLASAEKRRVVRRAVEQIAGRVPVLSGVAECSSAPSGK